MSKVSVPEAAEQLGVSPQRVRAMIAAGLLDADRVAGRWLIEVGALPQEQRRAGQPYSPRIAWAVMNIAGGKPAQGLAQSEHSRLRARWRKMLDAPDAVASLPALLARRARRMRISAPEPRGLLDDPRFFRSGRSDARSGMSSGNYAEGYVHAGDMRGLEFEHLLVPAKGAENVMLRVIPDSAKAAVDGGEVPWLAVVADLAEEGARERQQAEILWRERTSSTGAASRA